MSEAQIFILAFLWGSALYVVFSYLEKLYYMKTGRKVPAYFYAYALIPVFAFWCFVETVR